MSLQKRLAWLLTAFAIFSLLATFGTIYAVQLRVTDALQELQRSLDTAAWIDRLQLEARHEFVALRELLSAERLTGEALHQRHERFLESLRQLAQFALQQNDPRAAEELLRLTSDLDRTRTRFLERLADGDRAGARRLLEETMDGELRPALAARLRSARLIPDDARNQAVDSLVANNTQILALALTIGVVGIGLVIVGTTLVRRWIVMPLRRVEEATGEFSRGRLDYRLAETGRDEFGALGRAMNEMAARLATAQDDLRRSEAKYRSLFENLRDAAVICDAQGRIVECHEGDSSLLGLAKGDCTGRLLSELWPGRLGTGVAWLELVERVLATGRQTRLTDLHLPQRVDPTQAVVVDVIAYPVHIAGARHVALVIRDETERRRLERRARRAEAMEATVTLARGVAHDFNGLLSNAIGALSLLNSEVRDQRLTDVIRRALRSAGQASALARTLLSFAGGDRGHPEVLCLRETVELILESLDESFLERLEVETDLNADVCVTIDRDQLTQIVLNLVRNAREAMKEGGRLSVRVEADVPPGQHGSAAPPSHAVLTVADTGCGLPAEVRERMFEPFFTTKPAQTRRSRGMGLAVVYAAVKSADGFIQVDSAEGAGTTFRVFFPLQSRSTVETESSGHAAE